MTLLILVACRPELEMRTFPADPRHDFDGDGATEAQGDCNDERADIHPGAKEACNATDDDCDGVTDEQPADGSLTVFRDADGDGSGSGSAEQSCILEDGWSETGGDCDDLDPDRAPDLDDSCYDAVDSDCDGETMCETLLTESLVSVIGQEEGDGAGHFLISGVDLGEGADGLLVCAYGADGVDGSSLGGACGGFATLPTADVRLNNSDFRLLGEAAEKLGKVGSQIDGESFALGSPETDRVMIFQSEDLQGLSGAVLASNAASTLLEGEPGTATGQGVSCGKCRAADGAVLLVTAGAAGDHTLYALDLPLPSGVLSLAEAAQTTVTVSSSSQMSAVPPAVVDTDGDGIDELVLGMPGRDQVKVYPHEAGTMDEDAAVAVVTGAAPGHRFGSQLLAPGDLDQDGYEDLLVSAVDWDFTPKDDQNAGAVYLLEGPLRGADITVDSEFPAWTDARSNAHTGVEMAGMPDQSGDGVPEVLIGTVQDPDECDEGLPSAAYIVVDMGEAVGQNTLTEVAAVEIQRPHECSKAGSVLSSTQSTIFLGDAEFGATAGEGRVWILPIPTLEL